MTAVIYTCTFLDYDLVFTPLATTLGAEFVLLSDRRPRLVRRWRWRPIPEALRDLPQHRANRWCKFFAHELFPEAEISVYVDGNFLLRADLAPLIAEFRDTGAAIGLFRHASGRSVAEEVEFALATGRIPPDQAGRAAEQLAEYRAAGFDADTPVSDNGVLFRRHGAPGLAALMQDWWDHLLRHTRRDQISLPFLLDRHGVAAHHWDFDCRAPSNPWFRSYAHRKGGLDDLRTASFLLKDDRPAYALAYRALRAGGALRRALAGRGGA